MLDYQDCSAHRSLVVSQVVLLGLCLVKYHQGFGGLLDQSHRLVRDKNYGLAGRSIVVRAIFTDGVH